MEPYCEEGGVFYMGAQTVWLPAEHFMNINNWDDSLKPSASYYIKQVEEWIASMEEGDELVRWIASKEEEGHELALSGVTQDISHTISTPINVVANEELEDNATTSVIIAKPTSNEDVESNDLTFYSFTVDGAKPYACSECGKAFSQRSILTRHLRVHSGEKPFVCGRCGRTFSRKSNMKAHLRLHSGEKPYACIQCGKAFADKNNLKRHFRLHSGEKPFSCEKCGKSFTHSNSKKNHVKQCKVSNIVV